MFFFDAQKTKANERTISALVHMDTEKKDGVIELTIPDFDAENPSMRAHVQIVVVVDTSFSMQNPAICKGENGEDLNKGWSNLDINIHGISTIIGMLQDGDNLSIIDFASDAQVLLEWTNMSEAGRTRALNSLKNLQPRGSTNLTAAMNKCKKILKILATQ